MATERLSVLVIGGDEVTMLRYGPSLHRLRGGNRVSSIGWVDPAVQTTGSIVARYGGYYWADQLDVALHSPLPDGVLIASPPSRLQEALTVIEAGVKHVLLEPGGKTGEDMRAILDVADVAGATVQMAFPELLAVASALAAARKQDPFEVDSATYKLFRRAAPPPGGGYEELVPYGIAMVLDALGWRSPLSIEVETIVNEHYRVRLFCDEGDEPAATIEVGCSRPMAVPEVVSATLGSAGLMLSIPLPTTCTPERVHDEVELIESDGVCMPLDPPLRTPPVEVTQFKQSDLWFASFDAGPPLPVNGRRCLRLQLVHDAGRTSLEQGGGRTRVESAA